MKKHYLLSLLFPILGFSQTTSVVNITTADLEYSAAVNKIYVAIPANAASNANSIGMINPTTALVENNYAIGNDPTVMAISANGQVIYAGLKGTSTVRKFDVATNTPGIEFQLGTNVLRGDFYAEDIAVLPGNANAIAVARRNHNYAPKHEGVAVYDNGVMRTAVSPNQNGSNKIAFYAADKLVGLNNESNEKVVRWLDIVASGVTETLAGTPTLFGKAHDFCVVGNIAFFDSGKVLNIVTHETLASNTDTNGPVAAIDANTVCYASTAVGGAMTLRFYDLNGSPIGTYDVPQAIGKALHITACGSGCVAVSTPTQVIIVNNLLSAPSFEKSGISLYPNPVANQLNISSPEEILSVSVFDITGRKVIEMRNINKGDVSIDTSALTGGAYLVNVSTAKGIYSKKIVKP